MSAIVDLSHCMPLRLTPFSNPCRYGGCINEKLIFFEVAKLDEDTEYVCSSSESDPSNTSRAMMVAVESACENRSTPGTPSRTRGGGDSDSESVASNFSNDMEPSSTSITTETAERCSITLGNHSG